MPAAVLRAARLLSRTDLYLHRFRISKASLLAQGDGLALFVKDPHGV